MSTLKLPAEQFLRRLPLFTDIREEDIQVLLNIGTVKQYTKSQHLFFQNDPASTFFIVISGCVKQYRITIAGDESVISLRTNGETLGEASIFDGSIHPFSACAIESCEIFEIGAALLKQTVKASPGLTAKIMVILSDDVHKLQLEKEHIAIMSSTQRVGCKLLQFAGHLSGKGGTLVLPYDKSLMASNLSMKPETFSRALKELRAYGVSVKGSEITIENFEHLSQYCCIHCSLTNSNCKGNRLEESLDAEEHRKSTRSL